MDDLVLVASSEHVVELRDDVHRFSEKTAASLRAWGAVTVGIVTPMRRFCMTVPGPTRRAIDSSREPSRLGATHRVASERRRMTWR